MDPISQREGLKSQLRIEPENMASSLRDFIRGYTEKLERDGVTLGLSGGWTQSLSWPCVKGQWGPKGF